MISSLFVPYSNILKSPIVEIHVVKEWPNHLENNQKYNGRRVIFY